MNGRHLAIRNVTHCIAIGCCWLGAAANTHGDLLWLKETDQPQSGWVVNQTDELILFRSFAAPDAPAVSLARTQVELVVITIDTERLAQLNPSNWTAYRDYAEELAVQKLDPTARELAIRLYVIGGHGASGDLRKSCLTGLIALANDVPQRERWRLLQRLESGEIEPESQLDLNLAADIDPADRALAIDVVRLIRRGEGIAAIELLDDPVVKAKLDRWRHLISTEQLKRLAVLNRFTPDQLRLLLRMELSISNPAASPNVGPLDWADYANSYSPQPVEIPSFKNATPYDPEASVFRDGQWQRPK